MNGSTTDRIGKPAPCVVVAVAMVAALLGPTSAAAPAAGGASEVARLRVTADRYTVAPAGTVTLAVTFLDHGYRPVANDRRREVTLSQRPVTGGRGQLAHEEMTVGAGASRFEVRFTGRVEGRVAVKVASEGLQPGEVLLSVRGRGAPGGLLVGAAWAAAPGSVEIAPRRLPVLPANGVTPAELYLFLDDLPGPDESRRFRLEVSPGASIEYDGGTGEVARGQVVAMELRGQDSSGPIRVVASRPGTVDFRATELPGSAPVTTEITFEAPRPREIRLVAPAEIPSHQETVPLEVLLLDADRVPVGVLGAAVVVRLASPTDGDAVEFEPATVRLGPDRTQAQSVLRFRRFPSRAEVQVHAVDATGELRTGHGSVLLRSGLRSLVVDGPPEIVMGRSVELSVRLRDDRGLHRAADLARRLEVTASRGSIAPVVEIAPGEARAKVVYRAPSSEGKALISVESNGLEAGTLEVLIVASTAILLLFAGIGGAFGGAAREIYRGRVRSLLPRWDDETLRPGLAVNLAFSMVFGTVLFLGARLGLVAFPVGAEAMTAALGTRTLAYFLGVMGGFAGVVLLDLLLDRLLPGRPVDGDGARAPDPRPTPLRP